MLSAKEIANKLNKSVGWVYAHAAELGAVRIGGSWIFTERRLNHAILGCEEETVACSSDVGRETTSSHFPYKARGPVMGREEARRVAREREEAARRHGLIDILHKIP